MGSSSSSHDVPLPPPAAAPPRPVVDSGLRVVCPRCHAVLLPPAQQFRCPCGQTMILQLPPAPPPPPPRRASAPQQPVFFGGASPYVMAGFGPDAAPPPPLHPAPPRHLHRGPSFQLLRRPDAVEERILQMIRMLPPDSAHARFLAALLHRLPRLADGTVDLAAMERIAAELDTELRGTPAALLELLPVRKYHPGERHAASDSQAGSEQRECMICLEEYAEGDDLKTLPCLHYFHTACIDTWLKAHRECCVCKTPVDAGADDFADPVPASAAAFHTTTNAGAGSASASAAPDGRRGSAPMLYFR